MARNPFIDRLFAEFGVADIRHIGTTDRWQELAHVAAFDPACRYFIDTDALVVIEDEGARWFQMDSAGDFVCVRACMTHAGAAPVEGRA